MFTEFIKAFCLIFIAEMGDKTQILAMAFATRYKVKTVLIGIFLGAFLNHGLAVAFGCYISKYIPINTIQIFAGFIFIAFGLWSLKVEEHSENKKIKFNLSPIISIALIFFIGELGDKTQLTAITLSADTLCPICILGGTVCGMMVTGLIGIYVGRKLENKIPITAIKIITTFVFIFFGLNKLHHSLPSYLLNIQYVLSFSVAIIITILILLKPLINKKGTSSIVTQKNR